MGLIKLLTAPIRSIVRPRDRSRLALITWFQEC
jgi:hypothetical protein